MSFIVIWSLQNIEERNEHSLILQELGIQSIKELILNEQVFTNKIGKYFDHSLQIDSKSEEYNKVKGEAPNFKEYKFIILAELNWKANDKAPDLYAEFYGFEIVRKIRTDFGLNNQILICSIFSKSFFFCKDSLYINDNIKKGRDYGVSYLQLASNIVLPLVEFEDLFLSQKETNLLICLRLLTEEYNTHSYSANIELTKILLDIQNKRYERIEKIYADKYYILKLFFNCLYNIGCKYKEKPTSTAPLFFNLLINNSKIRTEINIEKVYDLKDKYEYRPLYSVNDVNTMIENQNLNKLFEFFSHIKKIVCNGRLLLSSNIEKSEIFFGTIKSTEILINQKLSNYVIYVPTALESQFRPVLRQFEAMAQNLKDKIFIVYTNSQTQSILRSLNWNYPVYLMTHLNLFSKHVNKSLPLNLENKDLKENQKIFITTGNLDRLVDMLQEEKPDINIELLMVDEGYIFGLEFYYSGKKKIVLSYDYFIQDKSLLEESHKFSSQNKVNQEFIFDFKFTDDVEKLIANLKKFGGLENFISNISSEKKIIIADIAVFKSGEDGIFVFALTINNKKCIYKIDSLKGLQNELYNAIRIENSNSGLNSVNWITKAKSMQFGIWKSLGYLEYNYIESQTIGDYLLKSDFESNRQILNQLYTCLEHLYFKKDFKIETIFWKNCGFQLFEREKNFLLSRFETIHYNNLFQLLNGEINYKTLLNLTFVPLATIHGDLHIKNIIIDENQNVNIIDLNHYKLEPTRHIFKDSAKLFVSLYIEYLSNNTDNPLEDNLYSLISGNTDPNSNILTTLLSINTEALNLFKRKFKNEIKKFQLNEKETNRHFYVCVLHYLIKYATYIDYLLNTRKKLLKIADKLIYIILIQKNI